MVTFVVVIAVMNVCLGYLVCWFSLAAPAIARIETAEGAARPAGTADSAPELSADPTGGAASPAMPETLPGCILSADRPHVHDASHRPKKTPPPTARTLADYDQEFRTLRDRLRYARTNDSYLAKDMAAQLHSCVLSWHSSLADSVSRALADVPAADADQLEMCLAQLETTKSNIDSVDWKMPFDEILEVLTGEANGLGRLLKTLHDMLPDDCAAALA